MDYYPNKRSVGGNTCYCLFFSPFIGGHELGGHHVGVMASGVVPLVAIASGVPSHL